MTCPYCNASDAPVLATWDMVIPVAIPSQNTLAANRGADRWRYRELRDACVVAIRMAMRKHKIPRTDGSKRRAVITRTFTGRQREYDTANLVGGCKALVDAMCLERLLVSDAPEWFEGHYRQTRADRNETRITVEELG